MFVPKAFKYFFGSNILAGFSLFCFFYDFEFVKQHFAHLLRGGDVEGFVTRQCIDFFFNLLQAKREMFGRLFEGFRINTHSVAFDIDEHRHKRHFNFIKEMLDRLFFQFFFEDVLQFQCNVRIFAGVTIHIFRQKVSHTLLVLSSASDEFIDVNGLVVQINFGKVVHVVPKFRLQYIMGEHSVEKFSLHLYSVILKNNHIVFDILSYFHGVFIFIKRAEFIYDF